MTVCTAALFTWNYGTPDALDPGPAIIAASDRLLVDDGLGIKYEKDRWKAAVVSAHHIVMVSGAMTVHSDVLKDIHDFILNTKNCTTKQIADKWSEVLRRYTRTEAANLYLSPLNMDEETFVTRNKLLEPTLAIELAQQMQDHKVDAEAIVLGCDDKNASLYSVDRRGRLSCHDDIGFVSIGSGGIHASGHFMIEDHSHFSNYYKTLFNTFSAKKKAEVSPDVGDKFTDMFIITRGGVSKIPDAIVDKMEQIYKTHLIERKKMVERDLQQIAEADMQASAQPPPETNVVEPNPQDGSSS